MDKTNLRRTFQKLWLVLVLLVLLRMHAKKNVSFVWAFISNPVTYIVTMATDNAVSSVGRICATFGAMIDLNSILPAWLHLLPLESDEEEGLVVYSNLCNFIEQAGSKILGAAHEHLPKAVSVLVQVVDSDFTKDEQLNKRIITLLKSLQQLPPDVLQKTWASLSPELQAKLQKTLTSQ